MEYNPSGHYQSVSFADQLQIQQSNIIENVNKVARTLVDRVGGFGTQVHVA